MTCVFTPKGHKGDPMSYNEFRQFLLENPKYWADVAQKYAPDVIKIHNLSEADIKQAAAQAAAAPKPEPKSEEKPKPEAKKEEAPKEEKKPEQKPEPKQEKKSEEKPSENKPQGKPKTAAQKIADNLRKFAKAVRELPAASKEDAARNVARSLRSIGQNVMLLSDEDFQDAAKMFHAANGTKYIPSAEGWYFYKYGTILINKDVDIPDMPNVVVFHEGTHPVINIIRNVNPELYNRLINGLNEYKAKNPTDFLKVDQFVSDYDNPDLSPEVNKAKKNDEMITETIAQIASGNINIESLPFSLKQAIIDFINTVLEKLIQSNFRLKDTSDEVTFRRVATNVALALKEGRDIETVLNRELGGFGQLFSGDTAPNIMGPQARMNAKQRNAITGSPVYFDNVKEFASEAQTIENKIDFKNQLMKKFEKVLPKLQKAYGNMLDPSKMDDNAKQYIVDAITQEAYDAILKHPEAIGWYNEKTKLAIEVVSLIHPEIATDRAAKGAFIFALAVTSNGNKVDANFDLAEKQYRIYKETGRFNPDAKFGAQQAGIRKGFRLVNELLDQGISMDEITDFFTTKFTVGQLKKADKKGTLENIITGELVSEEVFGAAVLGSKIGNGFYMNLWGEYGQLTMDRWFMRTWGRVTGTLIKKDEAKVAKNKAKYEAAYQIIKKDKEAKAMLDKYLKGKSLVPTDSDKKIGITKETKEALVLNKIFTSAEVRTELNKNEKINEFRKAVNNYAKNLFGEIEAPASGKQRKFIRDVFVDIQKKLKTDYNIDIEMADLQAVLWYPEKILYESFKKGKTYEGIYETYKQQEAPEQTSEDITEEDDVVSGPPDYLNASIKLAQKNGISNNEVQRKLASARESLGLDTGGRDTGTGKVDSTVDQRTKAAVTKFYSAEPEVQASYGSRTVRANALANASTELANLLDESASVADALVEFKASVEFDALSAKEIRSMIQSLDNESRAEMGASLEEAAKEKEKLEQIERALIGNPVADIDFETTQFNEMGRYVSIEDREQFDAMENALSDIEGYDEFAEQHTGKEPVGKAIYNAVKEYFNKGVEGLSKFSGKAKSFIIAAAERVRKAAFNRAAILLMAGAVTAPAIYYSSPTALGVYQNASRFLAIQFGVGMPTEQEGLVDMSKVMAEPNQVSPAQKIVLNKSSKNPVTFSVRGSIKDERDPTGKTRLWMYVRDADNGDLTYVAGPKKGNMEKYGKPGVNNVEGVGHFMISMEDLTTLTDNNKLDQLKKGLLAQIKANTPNNYVPTFKRISGDSVKLTFKKLGDVNNEDIVMTQLVQVNADNINWYAKDNAKDFKEGIYALTDKQGNQINSFLFSPTKNNYNRFSGGGFYIIAETPNGIKVREMSGSLNMLKADIDAIAAKYGIPLSKIQIGAMDAGSFSAKPAARDGATAFEDYSGFNKIHLGEAASSLNIPIGGDIQQSKGSRVLNNTDIVSTKVNVAPLYSVKVNSIEQANSIIASDLYKKHKEEIQSLASAVGLKVDGMEDGIGGFAFDDGTEVKEATTVVSVTGKWDDIVRFAAVLGAITPEVQESTIAGQYVEEGAKNHKADEYTVQIDNTSAALIAAKEAGFGSSGFTLLDKEIKFFNVFKFPNENIGEMIANFVTKYEENGGTVIGEARRAVESEYIDYDKRGAILAEIEKSSLLEGSNWAGVRDRISDAFERNKAFAKWKKINKSIPAVEYRRLRQEQIDLGERGEVLSDEKLKRIKDIEELLVNPVARVFTNDEKKYLEAKAEIEAIANDIGKLVAGSFTSPFSIKRPDRGAIKVARWYSINPNLLGDGSRTNIIVNTDTDADFLFNEIKTRYSMEGDRVEYAMPTKLGYPKRLIEIRTSNGKIAEIQVMTQQGYLAKDGAKYFPADVKNLAAASLKEVQKRLGWNIPDGVGHYFYEIERDTNVPFDLRQEAIRVSNDYYDAFLNPDSTLTDSKFRQDVAAFKEKVDSANKSKWDSTNKGEAPASLEKYLNEAEQPQASMGSRDSTAMQEAANIDQQIADLRAQEQAEYDAMPDPGNKAKQKEIYDRYDKLISPLLAEKAEQPQASMGSRQLPASVRDQIRDVIAKDKVNVDVASKKIRKILEGVPNLSKSDIDEMVQKYEERVGAKTETEYFFDYVKNLQALNKLNVPQAQALIKQFKNFILSPEDLDNALDFVDRLAKNKILLDKVNQAKESFRMLKAIAKNKKLSKADKLFLSNLATPKFYLADEAELIKLREMALNFISSRLSNAEQKFTMAEIDAAYNEAAARKPAKERAKPKARIKVNSRPTIEAAVQGALAQYSTQLSAVSDLSKMDLSVLTTETLYKILNALKVYDETGVLFDIGQIAEMTRALNNAKTLKGTGIRATIRKLAIGGISAKLQSVAAGANEIRRILVGGWDRNAARVTSDTQTMRDELNKKFAELNIGLPERFLLGAYGFFKEQSKGQTTSLKADVLADQMNYLRDRIDNAKRYSSSGSEMRMLEHYYNGAVDALVKLGAINDVNGQWKPVPNFDIDSAVPKNVKEAWDYTQKLLQEKTQQYADALRLYHGRDFDLIQDYFPRSFYKVDVSSGDIVQGQGDQLPQMGSIDPVINKQGTEIADRNRGRTLMPRTGGFYILDGYETALNGLWDINATIHLSKDYAYTNALVNQGTILTDSKTNDAVKKYLISSVSGILRDPMLYPDTRAFLERFSDTAINSITSTVLNNFTQYGKQPLATTQGFIANPAASIRAANLMKQAMGNPALADALNKFFNNTSAPYAEQLAYNELESKYYQGDIVSDKARGFLNKISPESLVAANKFTQKQLLLTGYLAERGSKIDFIKEAADGFNETALASAENFAEAANSTANRHFLPLELKDAKAYKKWLYFLSTYTFVATAQFWNNMGILTKPGYTATQKRMAGAQAGGFLIQQLIFQVVTRAIREGLYEIGEALGWLEEEDEDEETKNQEKYWYQILAGVGIDTLVGPYASFLGDSVKYIVNSTAEYIQDKTAKTEEEEKEKLNLLYSKKSELPGAFSILEPLWKSGGRAITNGDEAEYWAIGIQAVALMLKIGDLYLLSKYKTRALESVFATADGDKLLRTMRTQDSGQYKNWVSEVRGAGVTDKMLSKLTFKVGDMGYYVDASDAKKFMNIYEKSVDEYSKMIKQNAQSNNFKISDSEILKKAEKIAEKQAQLQVKKIAFKLPDNY